MRLIDADKLKEYKYDEYANNYRVGWNNALDEVEKNEPTVETVPIKNGEWLPMYCSSVFGGSASAWGSSIAGYMCSECDEGISIDDDYAYCPYCGSRNVKKDD